MKYRSFGPNDDTPNHMGDVAIWGVKMRQEPHLVPPGYAASAVNMRFRRGVPETRLGTTMPAWAHRPDSVLEEEGGDFAILDTLERAILDTTEKAVMQAP